MDEYTKQLPVMLTQDEFDQRAAELAAVNMEIVELGVQKKASASDFKGKIEDAQARQSLLTRTVSTRSEIREVGCAEQINVEAKIVEIVRMDTGEICGTRSLTSKDIQASLYLTNLEADRPIEEGDGNEL